MLLCLLMLLGGRPILPDEVVAILLVREPHICRRREGLVHRLLPSIDQVHGGYRNNDRCKNGHKEHTHRRFPFLDADHAITRKAHVGFRFQARLAKRLAMKAMHLFPARRATAISYVPFHCSLRNGDVAYQFLQIRARNTITNHQQPHDWIIEHFAQRRLAVTCDTMCHSDLHSTYTP